MGRILAVYGTLKAAYGNHRLIQQAGLKPLGRAYTNEPAFFMQGGGFPYVYNPVPEEIGERIRVELYEFDNEEQIESIDRLEGHPNWYRRTPFQFIVDDPDIECDINKDELVLAEMYVIPETKTPISYGDNTVSRDIITKISEWNR